MKFPGEDLWFPEEATRNSVKFAITAIQKLSQRMAEADYSDFDPTKAGQTLAYLAKMASEITRLAEFAKGEADERVEVVGLRDLLKFLSSEQFDQVQGWIAAGQAKDVTPTQLQ